MTLYDSNLERCVIGALCVYPEKMKDVASFLRADDFTIQTCGILYQAMFDMFIKGEEIDVALLPQYIMHLDSPTEYIKSCMIEAPTKNNVVLHAEVVHNAAKERNLRNEVFDIFDSVQGEQMAASIIQKCQQFLEDEMSETLSMQEIVNVMCDKLNEPVGLRIDTGFSKLDGILKGMFGGNLVMIGARPAVGKSIMALTLAENAARKGHKVLFYSLEMLFDELMERYICKCGRIPLDNIIDRTMDDNELARWSQACNEFYNLPIVISDKPNMTVQQIKAKAITIPDVDIIFVDHIGLLKTEGKYTNRNLELGAISRELKNLATELEIPVVVLAQLNRGRQETDEPQLNDLRDSGELEQNASKVIMIWKADIENNIRGVKVAKNRRGKTGTVYMKFQGEYMTFSETDENMESLMREVDRQCGSRYDKL